MLVFIADSNTGDQGAGKNDITIFLAFQKPSFVRVIAANWDPEIVGFDRRYMKFYNSFAHSGNPAL
jgi:hypothetical protein